jgi:hypothetical protein
LTASLVLLGGAVVAALASEYVLREGRIQTRFAQILCVHSATGLAVLLYLVFAGHTRLIPAAILWCGMFLSWFGVRSHIESSILLRMAYMLRQGPMGEDRLLAQYEAHYGGSMRLEELLRAGLVEKIPSGMALTTKGSRIHRAASWLR